MCKKKAGHRAHTSQMGEVVAEFLLQGKFLGLIPAAIARFNHAKLKKKPNNKTKGERKKKTFWHSVAQKILVDI